ncbi:MAG: hypothetical protein HDR26_04830 [Lachnospiraceae bacterium]|nr:hypothetical protein [Lachnospiraceae bacterium]
MVSKKVLKKIGIFAMAAMVAASPVLAVSANGGIQLLAGSEESSDVSDPETSDPTQETPVTPAPAPSKGSSTSVKENVVYSAAGEKWVSPVPGTYKATDVNGVAVIIPLAEVKAAFGVSENANVSVNVVNSQHGSLAEASIVDGLEILAANGISAVRGPEVDIHAYVDNSQVTDIEQPIIMAIGIPESFRQDGYEYAAIRVQAGGKVSILTALRYDPEAFIFETDGFGVFTLVKAPAGSFDMFK